MGLNEMSDIFGYKNYENSASVKSQETFSIYTPEEIVAMKAKMTDPKALPKKADDYVLHNPSISEFKIKELENSFAISPLKLHDGLYRVEWSKELLDEDKRHTQDEWNLILQGSEWSLPSGQLYCATLEALYRNKDGNYKTVIEKLNGIFSNDFANHFMITSTRIKYPAVGLDEIIHDYGSASKYEIQIDFVGNNGIVNSESGFEDPIESLLGTGDLTEVEEVFEWVSGRKPYLWRLGGKPKNDTMLTLLLGGDNVRFSIDAVGRIGNVRPARGVVRSKISTGNKGNGK